MRLGVYAVYDRATCAYLPPFLARTDGEASRMFVASVRENKAFANNSSDYALWKLSYFDDGSGGFGTFGHSPDLPARLLTGLEAVALASGAVTPERQVTQSDLSLEGPLPAGPAV